MRHQVVLKPQGLGRWASRMDAATPQVAEPVRRQVQRPAWDRKERACQARRPAGNGACRGSLPQPAEHSPRALWAPDQPSFKQVSCADSKSRHSETMDCASSQSPFLSTSSCAASQSQPTCALSSLISWHSPPIQPQKACVPHTSIANHPRLDSTAALSNKIEARLRPTSCV